MPPLAEIDELPGGQVGIVDVERCPRATCRVQIGLKHGVAVFRRLLKKRLARSRHAIADAEHHAHGADRLFSGHVRGQASRRIRKGLLRHRS